LTVAEPARFAPKPQKIRTVTHLVVCEQYTKEKWQQKREYSAGYHRISPQESKMATYRKAEPEYM
jgi:hypothetical protein